MTTGTNEKNPVIAYELAKTRDVVFIDDNIGAKIGKLVATQSGRDALNLIDELDKRLKEAYAEIERLRLLQTPEESTLVRDLKDVMRKHNLLSPEVAIG